MAMDGALRYVESLIQLNKQEGDVAVHPFCMEILSHVTFPLQISN
jgi:hypothetical protein